MIRLTTAFALAAVTSASFAPPAAVAETMLNGSFGTGYHGANPSAELLLDTHGAIYGVSLGAGPHHQAGIVFKLSPRRSGVWPATTLYYFGSYPGDGRLPRGGLVWDEAGALYGVTLDGGSGCGRNVSGFECGTVFRLSPPATPGGAWTETILYSFAKGGAKEGTGPSGRLVRDAATGTLYGTTYQGGGTVFSLTPPATPGGTWTHTVLHSFTGAWDGANPSALGPAVLTADGAGGLYGTTMYGGADRTSPGCGSGCGVVFHLTPPAGGATAWTETVLFNFHGNRTGSVPYSGVIVDGAGNLYGTASSELGGLGLVYKLTPPQGADPNWSETVLHRFKGGMSGDGLTGGLTFDGTGGLYGTTFKGGLSCLGTSTGCGLVFHLLPPATADGAWTIKYLHRFAGAPSDGGIPLSGVTLNSTGALFGATPFGGENNKGAVFRIRP